MQSGPCQRCLPTDGVVDVLFVMEIPTRIVQRVVANYTAPPLGNDVIRT
jgi:hypothetical protein